ncbi:MAG: hypothetical protein JOZ41_13305, partial [Chloroflexi bacterium]|nr:hypothetical protein [Chloroflexota bacterium]
VKGTAIAFLAATLAAQGWQMTYRYFRFAHDTHWLSEWFAVTGRGLLAAALSAGVGWTLAASGHDSILARRLQWYANAVRVAIDLESYAAYRDQVDDHVTRNIRVARALSALPPGRLLVWGNTPWVYVLSDRLPATPYTSALRDPEVPGETAALRRAVDREVPEVVVVVRPPAPPLGRAAGALARLYRPVRTIANATIYVSDRAAGERSASATARTRSGTR